MSIDNLIQEITASETWPIRLAILRPHGQLRDCDFDGDNDADTRHFGAFLDDTLQGIVSIYQRQNSAFKGSGFQIRAMATMPEVRGQGVGSNLLEHAESYAFAVGADYIWANSRTSALGFYQNLGFVRHGQEFHIEGIGPHFLIQKLRY